MSGNPQYQSSRSAATASRRALSLSVVIVTRNRRDDLVLSLSLLEQQSTAFELVLVDNGSEDDSFDVVRERWPDARVVRLPDNLGSCGGRNRGIDAAAGDILVFVDDDAAFRDPDALSRLRGCFEREPALGIVSGHSILAATGETDPPSLPFRDKRARSIATRAAGFDTVGCAVRRSVFQQTGGFVEDYVYGSEELDLAWRALSAGFAILWLPDLVVVHRRSPLERPPGRWVYGNMRDRVRLALRHLPWRYVATYAALWWPMLLAHAARHGMLRDWLRGLREFLQLLPATLRERKPLPAETLRTIGALRGRLRY